MLQFGEGPLSTDLYRVGNRLLGPLEGYFGARRSTYRIVYVTDSEKRVVEVLDVAHRADVYRRR